MPYEPDIEIWRGQEGGDLLTLTRHYNGDYTLAISGYYSIEIEVHLDKKTAAELARALATSDPPR